MTMKKTTTVNIMEKQFFCIKWPFSHYESQRDPGQQIRAVVGAIKSATRSRQSPVFTLEEFSPACQGFECTPLLWAATHRYCTAKSLSNAEIVDQSRVQARPWSAPWVGLMTEVVALELDLIFDLVDQYLRQQDAHQLPGRKEAITWPYQETPECSCIWWSSTCGMARPMAIPPSRNMLLWIQLTSLSMQPLV